jgi:hypothetical protein
MARNRPTEADVKRVVKGVIDGGGTFGSVEIRPDGSFVVTAATIPNAAEGEPRDLRRRL